MGLFAAFQKKKKKPTAPPKRPVRTEQAPVRHLVPTSTDISTKLDRAQIDLAQVRRTNATLEQQLEQERQRVVDLQEQLQNAAQQAQHTAQIHQQELDIQAVQLQLKQTELQAEGAKSRKMQKETNYRISTLEYDLKKSEQLRTQEATEYEQHIAQLVTEVQELNDTMAQKDSQIQELYERVVNSQQQQSASRRVQPHRPASREGGAPRRRVQ